MSCIIKTTKSQNNLEQKGCPMPSQEQVSWSLVQPSSGSLQGQRLLTLSRYPFQCLTTLRVKKILLISNRHFPRSNLCLLSLFLSLYTSEKCLALSSLHPSIRWVVRVIRSPLSFLFWRRKKVSPCTSRAPVPDHLGGPPLDPLQYVNK